MSSLDHRRTISRSRRTGEDRFVEKVWFHSRVAGVSRGQLGLPDTVDDSFMIEPADTIESVRQAFLDACEHSRTVATTHDLDEQFPWHRGPASLRFIYGHTIAELARHAGHGDILTEQIRARRAAPTTNSGTSTTPE